MKIILDLETSLEFKDAELLTGNKFLNNAVMATHHWIAVTDDGRQVRQWHSSHAGLLLDYLYTGTVVGWNVLEFDLVLVQIAAQIKGYPWQRLETIDLFDLARQRSKSIATPTGVWYTLEEVAQCNLGYGKATSSAKIPALFSHDIEAVFKHCREDVALEKQLFELAQTTGMKLPDKKDKLGNFILGWTLTLEN
jgi:hypothetical protein